MEFPSQVGLGQTFLVFFQSTFQLQSRSIPNLSQTLPVTRQPSRSFVYIQMSLSFYVSLHLAYNPLRRLLILQLFLGA